MASSDATVGQTPDQYGQLHPVETPELIARKRQEMEDALAKLSEDDRKSLKLAQEKCPELLTDDFKLMFLRSEVFNADLAAKRYARYWDKRIELCGEERAFLPFTLDGALKGDSVVLEMGITQLLPATDPSGRSIIFFWANRQDKSKYERKSMARSMWYMVHAALENEETQKRGLLFLSYPHGAKFSQFDRELTKLNVSSIQGALPVRLSAIHVIRPPGFVRIVLPIISLFMSERTKKRIQLHFGSQEQVVEKLATFGIDKTQLPTDIGGDVTLDVSSWLKKRRSEGK